MLINNCIIVSPFIINKTLKDDDHGGGGGGGHHHLHDGYDANDDHDGGDQHIHLMKFIITPIRLSRVVIYI